MRFMIMLKGNQQSEAGVPPDATILEAMGKYNGELAAAGVLLAGEGLQPTSKGAKIRFSDGKKTVIDGPFSEAKEVIAGFWMLQVKSKDEAIEWVKRCPRPFPTGDAEIEIRQLYETTDFPAATPELLEQEAQLRARIAERHPK